MSQLQQTLQEIRECHRGQTILLSHGAYDLVHPGHVRHLEIAKSLADISVVGIWGDERVTQIKGPSRPINPAVNRLAVVGAFRAVDYVFEVPGLGWPTECMEPIIDELQPDLYFTSSVQHQMFGGAAMIQHPNGRTTAFVYDLSYAQKEHSSTAIIERVNTGAIT